MLNATIMDNKVLQEITFNYCLLDASLIESIMPCLCQNKTLETINFACNGLTDKVSYLMAKIIIAQSERRDNIVWSYSLRGEVPPSNEYKLGLKQLILSYNSFSDILASELVMALRNDIYVRSVDLKSNHVSEYWVKEFIKLFDTNMSLTNIDLRENEGFN